MPDSLRGWVQARVESGEHATADDRVRDLIRRDQEQADERGAFVAALIKASGAGSATASFGEARRELRGTGA